MAKYTLTIKDPDRIGEFLDDASKATRPPGLTDAEWDAVMDVRSSNPPKSLSWLNSFFEYGEYLRVEFDDEAKTATVVKTK